MLKLETFNKCNLLPICYMNSKEAIGIMTLMWNFQVLSQEYLRDLKLP